MDALVRQSQAPNDSRYFNRLLWHFVFSYPQFGGFEKIHHAGANAATASADFGVLSMRILVLHNIRLLRETLTTNTNSFII
jgi:hypothetical protein